VALIKAALVGVIGAVGMPYVARGYPGAWGGVFEVGIIRPLAHYPEFHFSIPIFLAVTIFAWGFFIWADK
jgi:hypothetical protein